MSQDLLVFERYIEGMLTALSAGQRRVFFSRLSRELARINATRMRANVNPDGQAFEPRKPQTRLRAKRGKVRRMFQKLPNHLQIKSSENHIEIGFPNNAAGRIAEIHHYGEMDAPNQDKPAWKVRYPQRQLIGLSDSDQQLIVGRIMEQVMQIKI